jgi:hypothetical protein
MVRLEDGFVKIRYPGYYWNVYTQELWSLKIAGRLRKMKRHGYYGYAPNGKKISFDGYTLSHKGQQVYINHKTLAKKVYTITPEFVL